MSYLNELVRLLRMFERQGPSASFTAWLQAEDGSGATTTVRCLSYDLAKMGVPVLLAKPLVENFDFRQIAVFLTQAVDRAITTDERLADVPWVIVFDAAHTQNHWDFVSGLCNGLKNLQRSVAVVVVQSVDSGAPNHRGQALGDNRKLKGLLSNTIPVSGGVGLGDHLGKYLPEVRSKGKDDWDHFIRQTVLPMQAARRSLFWLALRFWLFQMQGSRESFRAWLARKVQDILGADAGAYAGVLEVAVLARFRLALPTSLLEREVRLTLRKVASQPDNVLGVCEVDVDSMSHMTFTHPHIAEEVLQIASKDSTALAAINKPTCLTVFDLELHLLGRIISRPISGSSSSLALVEDIVTTALRVDPRVAPRNYQQRDRIVALFENVPLTVWDTSQVFNHHVAIARRHLATDPPSLEWTIEARREQFALAEAHICDAISNIKPDKEHSRESPLNLRVSLALTYDARARFEASYGNESDANEYRQKGDEQYRLSQQLDADNLYVLENFARFKLNRAKSENNETTRIRLIVEAIALLEMEQNADDQDQRDEPIVAELSRAYEMLSEGRGRAWLIELSRDGDETALVALARLVLGAPRAIPTPESLNEAEDLLRRVASVQATWRSQSLLYHVVSVLRPHSFTERLQVLRALERDGGFQWPMQLRLEYAILLYQVGDSTYREDGDRIFRWIRTNLRDRSGSMRVPSELKLLADPAASFLRPLRTSFVVKKSAEIGRSGYGVPHGWGSLELAFRPQLFPVDRIRPGRELDCIIQFTLFGPQAVPIGTRVD